MQNFIKDVLDKMESSIACWIAINGILIICTIFTISYVIALVVELVVKSFI